MDSYLYIYKENETRDKKPLKSVIGTKVWIQIFMPISHGTIFLCRRWNSSENQILILTFGQIKIGSFIWLFVWNIESDHVCKLQSDKKSEWLNLTMGLRLLWSPHNNFDKKLAVWNKWNYHKNRKVCLIVFCNIKSDCVCWNGLI